MPDILYTSPATNRSYKWVPEDPNYVPTDSDIKDYAAYIEQQEGGLKQSALGAFGSGVGQGLATMPGTVLQGVGAMVGSTGLEEAGKYSAQQAREAFPIDPMRREDFTTQAGQAVGQAIGQLGLGLATGGGSIGTGLVLGTAAAMGAASGSERAEQSGLTGARRMGRVYGSALTELASERLFGLGSKTFFKPAAIPTTIGQKGLRFAGTSLGEGGEEIAAGVGNNIVDNVTAAGLDIPTPDIVGMNAFKSYAEQGLLGMVGGTVFAGAQLALGSQAAATPVTRAYATVDGVRMDITDLSPTQRKDLGIDEATVEYESILPTEDADIASGIQNKKVRDMFTEMKTNSDAAALDQALNVGQASSVLATAMGAGTPAAGTPAAAVTPAPTQAPIVSTPGEEAMTSTGAPTPVGAPAAAAADITEFPAEGPTNLVDLSNLRFTGTPTQTPTFNATLQGDFTENRVEERVQTNEGGTPTEAGRGDSTVERGQVEPPVAENEAVAPAPPLVEPGGEGLLNVIAPREKGAVATAADELVKGIGGKLKPRARPATTPAAAPTAPAAPTQTEFPVPQAPASPQAIVNSIQDLTNTVTGGTAGTGSIGGAETISLQSEGEPTVSLPAAESPMPRGSGGLGAEGTGAPAAPAAAAPAAPAAAAPAGAPVTPEAAAPAAAAAAAPAAAPTGAPAAAPEAAATEEAPTEEPNTAEPEDYKTEDSKDIFVEPQKKGFFSQFFGEDNPYSPKEKQSDEMLRNEFVRPYIIDGRSKTTQQKTDEMYELMDTLRSRKRLEAQRQQNIAIDPKYGNYDAVPAVQLAEIYLYASRLNDGGRMLRDLKSVGSLFYYSYEGTGRSAARGLNAISHFVRKINIAKAYDIHRKGQSKNAAKNIGVDENDLLDIQGFVDGATIPTEDLNQGLGNAVVNTGVPGQAAVLVDDVVANQLRTQPAPPVTTASEPLVTEAEVAPQVAAEAASAAQAKAVERAQTESRGLDPDTTTEIGDNIFSINPEPKSPNAPKVTPAQARILVTQTLGFTPKNVAFEDTDVPNEDGDQYAGKVNKRTKQITINLRNINDSTHLKDVLFEEMDHLVYADPMVQAEIALLAENLPEDIRQEVRQYRPEFQREEATIRFMRRLEQEPNTSSLWKKFVDAVRAAIRRLFNGQLTTRDLKMAADRVAARSFQAMAAQTFLTGQGGTSYSLASESVESQRIDQEYLAAVEAGDMETAQRIVDEAAKKAGYTERMFHGTSSQPGAINSSITRFAPPSWWTRDKAQAQRFANATVEGWTPKVYEAYLKVGQSMELSSPQAAEDFIRAPWLQEIIKSGKTPEGTPDTFTVKGRDWLIPLRADQVKSADPVTRDDAGNIIPPSKRFQKTSDDIRYSLAPKSPEAQIEQEYKVSVEKGNAAVIASGHELTREVYDELKSKFKPKPRDVFYVADTEVIRNPSDSDRRRMSAEVRSEFGRDSSGDPATRFTKDTFNNTWIWKAHQGMHFKIEPGITSREGVEVNQNNRVPDHVELVQDALRANKPVPLKVQEQYPRYAEFFAKLPPYQTNRTTSDDIRYSVPNPNDPAPEAPDLGPNIFTEEASALAATTAKLRAKIKVQPPPKVAKVKADPNIEFTKGFIASWDRNSGKEKADAKPKEKIPAKEVISEFTSLPKNGKGYALTDTGRDAFLTALNQKLVNLGVPSDLAFEATRRAWATYSTKKQKHIDAKALREAQKSIAEQERLAKKEEARVTKPDRTAQAFIDRTDESQTEIVIEPGVKTGDPVAQALREASMAPRIGPGFDSSPEAKRAYVNSLSAKLVSLGVTQATAETASSRAWLKYQASRSSKEVELRDREALAAAKKETRQREIQAKKDEKAIQAAIDKPNNSAQSFMDSVDESQTEFMPAERTVDPVMQALREASSVPKIGAPFDLSSEAKKAFLTGLKSKLMSLGVDETMARNASDRAWTKYQTKRTAKQKTIRENEAAAKAKKAQDALDKPTNTAKDYLKPATAPKGPAVQDPVKKALRDAEKIPRIGAAFNSSPEARNAFMTGLSSKLISLGVEQQTAWAAANKAWSTYQTNLADKVTALRKDIEKNKMSSILTRELKKIPVYQQNDIQYVREYMKNILVFGGLAEDVADAAATLYLNEYVDLMKQTKVKTAEKFIESESGTKIKKKIASKPTEYDKLMEAVRLGVTDRSFTAALAFTTPSKFQAFTQADHDRMVALEEEIQDPDTPNLIKVQKVNELMKLADSRMNDINALNVFTGYLVNNTLSGIGTAAIQIFTPFYSMGTRLATDGMRGLMTKDPQRFIASLYAVMDAADTVTAEFKYSFGNDVFRRGQQAELRTLTDLRKVLDNNLKIYQTTTNGLEKVVAASKIALAAPDYVRRLYSAMDTASQSLFINQIKVVGIYDAMKKNGMSLKKFKDMLDAKRTFRDAYTLTLHGQGGYTKNQIRLIAEDAAMNDFGEKVAAAIGQGGAETISDVYKMADLEGPSEIGVAESADGHVIPFLLDVLDSIKAAGDKAGGEGAGQLAFRLVLGYPTTALKVLNRSLYFFPPTAVVRMILNKRYENQADFDPEAPRKYEMLRTESQKHQRMAELVTGSLASIILMALIMDERDKEEKDRRFAVHNLGPSDRAAKQAWRAAGNVQQSIQWRASETSPWISVSWAKAGLESLAPVLALVGTVYDSRDEIVDEGKMADHALNVAGGVMGVFNRPLSGLNDIGEILSGEKNSISQKSLASYTAFRASGLVPFSSLLKTYNRTQGPRDMSTATSTMMSQIPIAGPSLTEPGINLFGDPLEATPNELTYKLPILPVQVGLRQQDVPFYEKMLSKGQYPPLKLRTTFEKTYGPVTDSVWRQYVEKRGQMVKKLIIDRWTDLDTLSPEIYDKVLGKFAEAADETVIQELKIQRVPKPVTK